MFFAAPAVAAPPVPVVLDVGAERRAPTSSPILGALRWVPPGRLRMGGPAFGGSPDVPPYTVALPRGFWVMETEVTQAVWTSVTGTNPSERRGEERPVETITWCDAIWFANEVSAREGLAPAYLLPTGFGPGLSREACSDAAPAVAWDRQSPGYRLPTEAEWEWAARGGEEAAYAGSDDPARVAWHAQPAAWSHTTHPVRRLAPNAFGLHDMSGNVWEWCWDRFAENPVGAPEAGPEGGRVARGGSAADASHHVPMTARGASMAGTPDDFLGVRLVRSAR